MSTRAEPRAFCPRPPAGPSTSPSPTEYVDPIWDVAVLAIEGAHNPSERVQPREVVLVTSRLEVHRWLTQPERIWPRYVDDRRQGLALERFPA